MALALPKQLFWNASHLLSKTAWSPSNYLAFTAKFKNSSSSTAWRLNKERTRVSAFLVSSLTSFAAFSSAASFSSASSLSSESSVPLSNSCGELVCAFVNEKGPGKVVSEDVHFISEELGVLAVFDGVGGWKGITRPEAFPLALRKGLEHALLKLHGKPTPHAISPSSIESPTQAQSPSSISKKNLHPLPSHSNLTSPENVHSTSFPTASSPSSLSPSQLLAKAHEFAKHEVELGSSTACLIVVDKDSAKFDSANLGDSGWYLFKSSTKKIELWSEEQQHYWNCPYQIGGSKSKADKTDMADLRGEVTLDDGDIILLATDGLSDNLFREEITSLIAHKFRLNLSRDELNEIAKDLYHEASKKFDSQSNTPFRENYYKHTKKHQRHPNFFEGSYGKPDDVTLIIAQYSKANPEKKSK